MFRKRSRGTGDGIYELVWLGMVVLAGWGWGVVLGWSPLPPWLAELVAVALGWATCILILAAVMYWQNRY